MTEASTAEPVSEDIQAVAAARAKVRARNARWDLNIAVFLFAVLILVIILLFENVSIEIVGPIAIVGLVLVWLVGWRRGKQLLAIFYDEELAELEQAVEKKREKEEKATVKEEKTLEETIEEKVQKALRQRWQK
jgi:FtsZ-interacting cell division protein ZipA